MDALNELLSSAFAQRIGWALVHFLWQGVIVALVLAVLLTLLRHRTAQLRWLVSGSCQPGSTSARAKLGPGALKPPEPRAGDLHSPSWQMS